MASGQLSPNQALLLGLRPLLCIASNDKSCTSRRHRALLQRSHQYISGVECAARYLLQQTGAAPQQSCLREAYQQLVRGYDRHLKKKHLHLSVLGSPLAWAQMLHMLQSICCNGVYTSSTTTTTATTFSSPLPPLLYSLLPSSPAKNTRRTPTSPCHSTPRSQMLDAPDLEVDHAIARLKQVGPRMNTNTFLGIHIPLVGGSSAIRYLPQPLCTAVFNRVPHLL